MANAHQYLINTTNIKENTNIARSQAVARIADRTAKNCKGHVTYATPTFIEIYLCDCSALPIQSRVSNLKSPAQIVLKICSTSLMLYV